MREESFTAGTIYMLLSAVGLALTGLLGKIGLESMDLTALIYWRFLTAFILCLAFIWITGSFKGVFHPENFKMHLLRAFFVLVTQYCYYFYLEKATLLNAVVLLNTGPLFIPIIEKFVFKDRIGVSTWVAVIVSFIGAVCVIQPDSDLFTSMGWIGLVAGLSQAASQVVFGINSKAERSDLGVLYLCFLCAIFSFLPFLLMERSWIDVQNPEIYWVIVGIGIATLFNQSFRAAAYRHATPSKLASFMYFSVLLAGLWDWMFFDKIPNTLSLIGAALVVTGGILKVYLRHKILQKRG